MGDDSIVLDSKHDIINIRKLLKKEGLTESEINRVIHALEQENNVEIEPSGYIKIIKDSVTNWYPCLQSSYLDNRFPVLLAYEYLSLVLGHLIYNDNLNFIREFIIKEQKSKDILVERLQGYHYGPWHILYPEFFKEETVINIRFFERICFRVHFKRMSIKDHPDIVLIEDLKGKRTLFANSLKEVRENIFYT